MDKIVKITHGQCYKKIHFFRNAAKTSPDLNSKIIHELRALSMGPNEMIYQQGGDATQIYFVQRGRAKLFIDINNHVFDSGHL